MKVTMADIAKKLGVSTSAVSLALNNSPKVSEATRKKVKAAVKEMGYRTNPYVSTLMAARRKGADPGRMPVVALITATQQRDGWKEQYHVRRFVKGCTATMESLGIRPDFFWIGDDKMTARRLNEILVNRGIHGAALMTQGPWGAQLDYPWQDVATVSYGARQLQCDTDWIAADLYGNMDKALAVLHQQNLERIGFAMDIPFAYRQPNRWLAAYLMAQYEGRIRTLDPWLDPEPSFEGFKKWVETVQPEVIICVHPPTVMDWLERMGLKVPEDVGVVTIGMAEPGGEFSGIVENTRTCGKLAVEMLLDRIHRGEFGNYSDPHHLAVSGQWNRGKTVRYLP